MAKLTDDMKAILENQLSIVATASKDGTTNLGPKGSLHVVDEETLAYSEATVRKTLQNLSENPRVAVLVVDRAQRKGYQLKGRVEILSSGDLFDQVARRKEQRGFNLNYGIRPSNYMESFCHNLKALSSR